MADAYILLRRIPASLIGHVTQLVSRQRNVRSTRRRRIQPESTSHNQNAVEFQKLQSR
jgi:hypothetical protein